ncbi:MAG: hypothetical protein K0Q73_7235 [Paenibacillus sp.]|nr:hypothetical protein [Paenibacillus sp.]
MSEYLNKEAVMNRINEIRNALIERRNEGDECDQFANEAVADWFGIFAGEVESGTYDDAEIQRLREENALMEDREKHINLLERILTSVNEFGRLVGVNPATTSLEEKAEAFNRTVEAQAEEIKRLEGFYESVKQVYEQGEEYHPDVYALGFYERVGELLEGD